MIYFLTCPCQVLYMKSLQDILYPTVSQPLHYWHFGPHNSLLDVWRAVLWFVGCLAASLPSGVLLAPRGSLRSLKGQEEALGYSNVLQTYLYNKVGAVLSGWRDSLWEERGWDDMTVFISWDWAWKLPYSWYCAPQILGMIMKWKWIYAKWQENSINLSWS